MDMLIRRLDLSLYLLHVLLIAPGLGLHLIVCVSFDIQVQVFASAWVHIYCVQCTCLVRTMCISPCLLRTMYMYIVYISMSVAYCVSVHMANCQSKLISHCGQLHSNTAYELSAQWALNSNSLYIFIITRTLHRDTIFTNHNFNKLLQ